MDMNCTNNQDIKADLDNVYLETLFNDIPDAVLIALPDGTITHVNESFQKIFGYTPEEVTDRFIWELYDDASMSEEVRHNFRILAYGELAPTKAVRKTKKGFLLNVVIHGGPIFSEGNPVGVYIIYNDVSERVNLLAGLEKERSFWRELFMNAPEGIVLCDDKQIIIEPNAEFCRMFGYSPEEIIGKTLDDMITGDPENLLEANSITEKVLNGEKIACEGKRYRKDKRSLYVSMSGLPFYAGNKKYIYAIYRNIDHRKAIEEQLQQRNIQLENSMKATVETMARIVECRDPYTSGHQKRTSVLAEAIAKEMELPEKRVEGIRIAAMIHDMGKINIPSEILTKPARLTDIEYRMIKQHPTIAFDILKDIEFPWPIANIILQHHERMDGSGYPKGLSGDEILLEARILAVADVVEAMSSHRPYRPGHGIDVTLEEIESKKGLLYDENVASACLVLFRQKGFSFDPSS
jgi:PAS domain S-box-containing protein/putative nucleotidyltransferase with HDIG domain